MDDEVWPPPPTGQPSVSADAVFSLAEQWLGIGSLCLSLAGAGLFFAVLASTRITQRNGTQTPESVMHEAMSILAVFVFDALAVVAGFLGRRTPAGRIGLWLPVAALVAVAVVALLVT